MIEEKKLPPCYGTYEEGDKNCDGDGSADSQCSYRKRCGAFKRYLGSKRKRSSSYLAVDDNGARAKHGYTIFMRFCEQLLKDESKTEIAKHRRQKTDPNWDKRRDGPCVAAKRKSRATKAKRAREKRQKLLSVFSDFRINFETNLTNRTFAASDQIMSVGQFYVFDRVKTSDYIGIRCKTIKGVDRILVAFKLKTSTMSFDIKLPFSTEELESLVSKAVFKKLSPVDIDEGKLKSIIKNARKEKVGLVCEFLFNAVNAEKVELPKI